MKNKNSTCEKSPEEKLFEHANLKIITNQKYILNYNKKKMREMFEDRG